MASNSIDIIARFVDKVSGPIKKVQSKLQGLTKTARKQASVIGRAGQAQQQSFAGVGRSIRSTQKRMEVFRGVFGESVSSMEQQLKRLQKKFLAAGLSMLFTGMAIKRVADTALRALFNTMQLATSETSEFSVLTNKLAANWAFFKFTLMDALMQTGLFQAFIGFLINVIQTLSSLPTPVKVFIVVLLVLASVIGGVMMIAGQSMLAFLAIAEFTSMATAIAWMKSLGAILGIIGILVVAAVVLAAIWGSEMGKVEKILWTVVTVLGAVAAAAAILGFATVGVWVAIAAAIIGILALIWKFRFRVGQAFGYLMKFLLGAIEFGLTPMFWALDKVIRAVLWLKNLLTGSDTEFKLFDEFQTKFDEMQGSIDTRIDELGDQARANRSKGGVKNPLDKLKDGMGVPDRPEMPTKAGSQRPVQQNNNTWNITVNKPEKVDEEWVKQKAKEGIDEDLNRSLGASQQQ